MTAKKFTLVFAGSASVSAYRIPRHRRYHSTLVSAREAARRVREEMAEQQLPIAAHPAIVYGPGCGRDGLPV